MAKGLECYNCTGVTEFPDAFAPIPEPSDGDECGTCDSTDTMVVQIEPCPAPEDEQCISDDHHFGIDKHVIELDR